MDGKSTQVRETKFSDSNSIISFADKGYKEAGIDGYTNLQISNLLTHSLADGTCFVLTLNNKVIGFIGGTIVEAGSVILLNTLAWYVEPEYRGAHSIKLLKQYINKAKEH